MVAEIHQKAMHQALERGLEFAWREDAVRINLLVADAPPHDKHLQATWTSGLLSRAQGIHIVSLAASGVDDTAEFMMRGPLSIDQCSISVF